MRSALVQIRAEVRGPPINVGAAMFMRTLIIRMGRRIVNARGTALVFLARADDKGDGPAGVNAYAFTLIAMSFMEELPQRQNDALKPLKVLACGCSCCNFREGERKRKSERFY